MSGITTLMIAALALCSCAPTIALNVAPLEKESTKEVKGDFTLIYFVGTQKNDIRRAVILDAEGDEFEFLPDVRDFEYEILQNVSIGEAIYEARIFFKHERNVTTIGYYKILSPDGRLIGMEMRPGYRKEIYGDTDILDIDYAVNEHRQVLIDIDIKSGLVRRLF